MISGECRVDAIPPADGQLAGHRLSIEGLRLRLDLRIVPGAAGADGSAVLRVESANVTTLPVLGLSVPLVYRRAAVLSSLAALAFAMFVWFAGSPRDPAGANAPELTGAAAPAHRAAGGSSAAGATSAVAPSRPPAERAPLPPVAPTVSPVNPWHLGVPAGNTSAPVAPAAPPPGPVAPAAGPAARSHAPPSAAGDDTRNGTATATGGLTSAPRSAERAPGTVGTRRSEAAPVPARPPPARPAPAEPASGRGDSLDLFADTK